MDQIIQEFRAVTMPHVHRRTGEILKDCGLPELHEYALFLEPSEVQRRLLTSLSSNIEKFQLFKYSAVSSRIANHPDVLWNAAQKKRPEYAMPADRDGDCDSNVSLDSDTMNLIHWASEFDKIKYQPDILKNSPKMMVLMKILEQCRDLKEKVLVFSQSIGTLDVIEKFLAMERYSKDTYVRIDGQSTLAHRANAISVFNDLDSQAKIALISTKAGGQGITLTAATRVVLMDVSWNPCNDGQAIHRAYRIGQSRPVYVYRLICTRSMEERLFNLQRKKMYLFQTIVDHANKTDKMLSRSTTIGKDNLMAITSGDPEVSQEVAQDDSDVVLQKLKRFAGTQLKSVGLGHDSPLWDTTPADGKNHRKRGCERTE
jgi:SNF2 family DNA or RNA helicase